MPETRRAQALRNKAVMSLYTAANFAKGYGEPKLAKEIMDLADRVDKDQAGDFDASKI